MPPFILSRFVRIGRWLNERNLFPKSMIDNDPLFASCFIANLGSVGIDASKNNNYDPHNTTNNNTKHNNNNNKTNKHHNNNNNTNPNNNTNKQHKKNPIVNE